MKKQNPPKGGFVECSGEAELLQLDFLVSNVLAFRNPSFNPRWREIGNTAKALRTRTGLDYPKYVQRLEGSRRLRYL